MLRDGASVVIVGSSAGVIVFAAFARPLSGLTFAITPRDPGMIAFAVASVLTLAAMAIWLPARRAARVNPTDALKA